MEKLETFNLLQIREAKVSESSDLYIVEGYASTWENEYPVFDYLDDFGFVEFYESFERGAFEKSITARGGKDKKNAIKMLYQHDRTRVLGTPTFVEDDFGLKFRCEIAKNVSYSKDAVELVENGDLRQLSIGFNTVTYKVEKREDETLHVKHEEVFLREFSLVTWAANEEALIIKNRSNTNVLNLIREIGKDRIVEVLNSMTNKEEAETKKEEREQIDARTTPTFVFVPLKPKESLNL